MYCLHCVTLFKCAAKLHRQQRSRYANPFALSNPFVSTPEECFSSYLWCNRSGQCSPVWLLFPMLADQSSGNGHCQGKAAMSPSVSEGTRVITSRHLCVCVRCFWEACVISDDMMIVALNYRLFFISIISYRTWLYCSFGMSGIDQRLAASCCRMCSRVIVSKNTQGRVWEMLFLEMKTMRISLHFLRDQFSQWWTPVGPREVI